LSPLIRKNQIKVCWIIFWSRWTTATYPTSRYTII